MTRKCKHASTTRLTEQGIYSVASCDDCGAWLIWKRTSTPGMWFREAVLQPLLSRPTTPHAERSE